VNTLRVLVFAVCFRQLKQRYPSMFDGARALAEIEAVIAQLETEAV
jgi:hypothetical protein